MPAIEERELSEHDFIGHVFAKASPILTWRPTKVQRITPSQIGERRSDPDDHRFSRAPTKRMVTCPVVSRANRGRTRALRAFLTLVTFSLLCGSALTLCVYVLLGDSSPFGESATASHANVIPTRAAIPHVTGSSQHLDTLVTAAPVPEPVAIAVVPAHRTAARGQQATHATAHAQRGRAFPAASSHAARAAHAAAGSASPNRRAT